MKVLMMQRNLFLFYGNSGNLPNVDAGIKYNPAKLINNNCNTAKFSLTGLPTISVNAITASGFRTEVRL